MSYIPKTFLPDTELFRTQSHITLFIFLFDWWQRSGRAKEDIQIEITNNPTFQNYTFTFEILFKLLIHILRSLCTWSCYCLNVCLTDGH